MHLAGELTEDLVKQSAKAATEGRSRQDIRVWDLLVAALALSRRS
jgi:hypothetical protein